MRKHPHRNHGPFEERADGTIVRIPTRRAHGLFKDVKPAPSAVASAKRRARLYMHSAARNAVAT